MRRCDIVSGILLILSIIDFALAAPVLAQEKRQASVNMVHIPNDVLDKRWEEDLEKLGEEYFKTGGKPVESSATLASSSSAPSGPDYGSTNVVQPLAPNSASSTANPDPLTDPSSCSPSTSSKQGPWARGNCFMKSLEYLSSAFNDDYGPGLYLHGDGGLHNSLLYDPAASGYNSARVHGWTEAHAPQPNPNLNPDPNLLIHPSADPNFDWKYWMNAEDPPPQGSVPPKEFGQAHVYQVDHANPPSTSGHAPGPSPTMPEPKHEVETPPSPKGPEEEVVPGPETSPDLDHQSSSTDSQPVDLQAAIYAAKGKAKESRRISGTARDVGNHAAQRELHPAERSLDPGE
jgi:hypothetical protein